VFIPLQLQPALDVDNLLRSNPNSETTWLTVMGRLRSGVSPAQARAELTSIAVPYWGSRMSPDDRAQFLAGKKPLEWSVVFEAGSRGFTGLRERFSQPLQVLMVLVGLVLLISC